MERLPQIKNIQIISIIALVFMAAGLLLSVKYIGAIKASDRFREEVIALNDQYVESPIVDIDEYHLAIFHKKQTIEVTAKVDFTNNSGQTLSELIFSLNNGFEISRIECNDHDITFSRKMHIVVITPDTPLKAGEKKSLTFYYQGIPDDRLCYLDIDTTTWHQQFRMFLLNVDNRFGIIENDYLLLTRETNWYPSAGAGYSPLQRFRTNKDFANYTTEVTTHSNLTVISQGILTESKDGHFIYKTDVPVPQISLTIGEYEKLSVEIDSVEYALYRKKGHNYWTQHFTELGDTVGPVIKELITDYERKLGLTYPYSKCYLVEVPIQFSALPRFNTVSWDYSQPEMILVPENGFMLFNADFRQMGTRRFNRRNEELTEKEKQINMLKRGFNGSFAAGTAFIQSKARTGEVNNYFSLFPLYYSHVFDIKSDKWPIMNLAVESYFNSRIKGQMESFIRRMGGLSAEEKANLYLQTHTLKYYLENEKNRDKLNSIINVKGDYLFTVIKYKTGVKEFNNILDKFLQDHQYRQADFNDFLSNINENDKWDINHILDNWYNSEQSPTYAFDLGEYYKVMKDNKEVNQIIFRITNHSEIEGFFTVTFEEDRGDRRGFSLMRGYGSDSDEEYIYNLLPGETKEIGLQPAKQTRSYYVNTIVSNNIPPTFQRWTQHYELKENALEFEGERQINKKVEFEYPNEIVVDNTDKGFKLTEPGSNKFIKNLFESKKDDEFEYVNFDWQPQPKWSLFANTEVYGRTIHSAYYTKPGKGDFKATWKAKLPESGKYDVYTFVVGSFVNHGHGRGRDRNRDGAYGSFIYTIYHDDGNEEVPLVLKEVEHGWNLLGEFYFSGDSATVELTNKGEPPMIITADAVKWVKK